MGRSHYSSRPGLFDAEIKPEQKLGTLNNESNVNNGKRNSIILENNSNLSSDNKNQGTNKKQKMNSNIAINVGKKEAGEKDTNSVTPAKIEDFKYKLAEWAIKHKIPKKAVKDLLKMLRIIFPHFPLPSDTKELLKCYKGKKPRKE